MGYVAYFLDVFPVTSETFILQEILELKKKGLPIKIFAHYGSQHYPFNEVVHPESEDLVRETHYVPPEKMCRPKLTMMFYHFITFLRRPVSYVRTFRFALKKRGETLLAFKLIPEYIHIMKRTDISHIHAHYAGTACEYAMIISLITGIPFSFSAHAYDIYSEDAHDMTDFLRQAKFAVTCTEYNVNYLREKYGEGAGKKVFLNYHGVYTDRFRAEIKTRDQISILSIGRLVEKKGYQYLLQAVASLIKNPDIAFTVTIIGDGPENARLRERAEGYGLNGYLAFTGALPYEQVVEHYKRADLLVLPCVISEDGNRDGIPNVILEAMSAGIPVIATNISGIPEAVKDGFTGLLIPPNDSEALAWAMKKLCSDGKLRQRLGLNARKEVLRRFSKPDQIEELMRLFPSFTKADIPRA